MRPSLLSSTYSMVEGDNEAPLGVWGTAAGTDEGAEERKMSVFVSKGNVNECIEEEGMTI